MNCVVSSENVFFLMDFIATLHVADIYLLGICFLFFQLTDMPEMMLRHDETIFCGIQRFFQRAQASGKMERIRRIWEPVYS